MKARPIPPLSSGATYCTLADGSQFCTGSAMGRPNSLPADRAKPIRLRLFRMREADRTCYDSGGAYWGCWSPTAGGMWRALGETTEEQVELFTRALTRAAAKERIRASLPAATFYH